MGLLSGVTIKDLNLGSIFTGAGQLFKDIRTAITGKEPLDSNKAAELQLKLNELEQMYMTAQTQINLTEAQHPSLFVAGWRPFVGWTCGIAFMWQFFLGPVAQWILAISGKDIALPNIDPMLMVQVLFAMLGVSWLRTSEKIKGVAGTH